MLVNEDNYAKIKPAFPANKSDKTKTSGNDEYALIARQSNKDNNT